jgi:hypothetical protein
MKITPTLIAGKLHEVGFVQFVGTLRRPFFRSPWHSPAAPQVKSQVAWGGDMLDCKIQVADGRSGNPGREKFGLRLVVPQIRSAANLRTRCFPS